MRILDNIYFWLTSLIIIIASVITYYIWFYNPEEIVLKDILNNSDKYEELVNIIKVNHHINAIPENRIIAYNKIPEEIKQKLSELKYFDEPDYLSIEKDTCNNIDINLYEYRYTLMFNECGNVSINGYHKNGSIEWWDINKNWVLMFDNDFM